MPESSDWTSLEAISSRIVEITQGLRGQSAALVAITGIDGAGKGYVTARLAESLESGDLRAVVIHADDWLNLPPVRFSEKNPAQTFYEYAIRFDELFESLVFPLRTARRADVEADVTEETALAYRRFHYRFENIDVILLEGIYLLKRRFQGLYDLSIWVDCAFETALERAIRRGQEGLPPEQTARAYEAIYFPAQRLHFEQDGPREAASIVYRNDVAG